MEQIIVYSGEKRNVWVRGSEGGLNTSGQPSTATDRVNSKQSAGRWSGWRVYL